MPARTPEAESHEGRLHRLAHRLAEDDPSLKFPRRLRVAMTIGPFLGFGVILLFAWLLSSYRTAIWLALIEIGSFIGLGKFVIFGGTVREVVLRIFGYVPKTPPPSPWVLAATVVYGDIATAMVLLANMGVLYRMGRLGRRLAACHDAGWSVLRTHRWMRRAAWVGVALFVAAPFQGTGAVIGTILARILGMSWFSTLSATAVGSLAGCLGIALLGSYAQKRVQAFAEHPVAMLIALATSIAIMVLLGRWFLGRFDKDGGAAADQEPK